MIPLQLTQSAPTDPNQAVAVHDDSGHEYKVPERVFTSPFDMRQWEKSEAYSDYLDFILSINEAIKGKPLSVNCNVSDNVKGIIDLLGKLDKFIDDVKPMQQPLDNGNPAFCQWYSYVENEAPKLLKESLPEQYHRAFTEIKVYLTEGFGNAIKIDYGARHEISFLMFLCCLFKIGAFVPDDKVAVATRIFPRYLDVVRKLQQTYNMEPASNDGVWSLDDYQYQFIPFIWGSAQLIGVASIKYRDSFNPILAHPKIEPSSFLNEDILNTFGKDYLYLGCIDYINKVKTGKLAEHANQLWGISGVSHWAKVNSGLIEMYKMEVLNKYTIVQHLAFGSLLPFKRVPSDSTVVSIGSQCSESSSPTSSVSKETEDTVDSCGDLDTDI